MSTTFNSDNIAIPMKYGFTAFQMQNPWNDDNNIQSKKY